MCKEKEQGRLGIKDMKLFNMTLLAKWKWRLRNNEKGLWKQRIHSKYGEVTNMVVRRTKID